MSQQSGPSLVQFTPLASVVSPAFWHALTDLKIDVLRLSDAPIPIIASYSVGRTVHDRETGKDVALGCTISIGESAFDKVNKGQVAVTSGGVVSRTEAHDGGAPFSVNAEGVFKNYNTIEEFKAAEKTKLFNDLADEMWKTALSTRSPSALTKFLMIVFADLKKYKYYYWFAFPAFLSKPAWEISSVGLTPADKDLTASQLASIHAALADRPHHTPYFLARPSQADPTEYEIGAIEDFEQFFEGVPSVNQIVGFVDPSALPDNPGWPLRNLLAFLRALYPSTAQGVRVLCWRDEVIPAGGSPWKSRYGVLSQPTSAEGISTEERPSAAGWEKNVQGKLGPRVADLAPMMDPTRLADQAVDLNLKLMRWRILPALDLDKVAQTRCLLLGAGTLGCYVARTLMGWGVRTITLVDSARVSFSNPVRQPLFEFEDCLDGGKPKAACAAERLKKIFPGVNATGHSLSIPMPGHPIPDGSVEQAKKDVETLEKLFDEHDAVFLLMDSRESRWLPTVLGAAKGKIVMNAALGFDTFLVMRHGARASSSTSASANQTRLGCYYCNDIVAPADSLTDRTLDQMCTVTRPGLASIASSTAVELLVSLLQHPDGLHAPAPPPQTSTDPSDPSTSGSILGLVPHQLRGYLAQFRNIPIVGAAYDRCTGCSETVLKAYEKDGIDMLLRAFNEQKYLEQLTGLDKLYDEGEAALQDVDWAEEEEEED